jgi:uncharacterized protein (DUF433 family)
MELIGDDAAIARWIEIPASSAEPGQALLLPRRVPVWAIVGQLKLEYWKPEVVAGEYELPVEAVQAAAAYYRRHQSVFDEAVAANRAYFRV